MSHGDAVNRIAFSRDGRYLAVGSGGKDLWVIETATGKEVVRTPIGAAAKSIAFSTDNRYCAVAADDATVRVLETPELWFGVTYPADKPIVVAGIRDRIAAGVYPERLWA